MHPRASRLLLLALALCVAGCAASDPRSSVLNERARWTVAPLNWTINDEWQVQLSTRISGPVRSDLKQFTFRVRLVGLDGGTLKEVWRTVNLEDVPMGGPQDKIFVFDASDLQTRELDLQLSMVLEPTAEEERHIVELQLEP